MRQTWIFQGNPSFFDVDGFFRTKPAVFLWQANQSQDRMQVGDQVFMWRAIGGDDPEKSGVIAEAEIIEPPKIQEDTPGSIPFWRQQNQTADGEPLKFRVRLRLVRAAEGKTMLKREWLLTDPILKNLTIVKTATGTNWLVLPEHAARLMRCGRGWDGTGTTQNPSLVSGSIRAR